MLVFISDLHLHDGSVVSQNVSAKQVHDFWHNINRSKKRLLPFSKNKEPKVEIIVLGDFLDLIRTNEWDDSRCNGIKPWSPPSPEQKAHIEKIVDKIFANNKEALDTLRRYVEPRQVRASYMIGNHDHLLLRYPDLFKKIHERLGFDYQEQESALHYYENFWPDYGVLAHHGDRGDPWNDTRGLLPPIGDAMVTEIYNRFPEHVAKAVSGGDLLKNQLSNLVFVRPYRVAPLYVISIARQFGEESHVKNSWNELVEGFLEVDFVKMWLRESRKLTQIFSYATALKTTMKISRRLEFRGMLSLFRIVKVLRLLFSKYPRQHIKIRKQLKELDDPRIRYLVNGHTHTPGMLSVGRSKGHRLYYVNTGTWTRTLLPEQLGPLEPAVENRLMGFTPGDFISYATFLTRQENPHHDMEFWSGRINPRED